MIDVTRELVLLGSRTHSTQRQMSLAGIPSSAIDLICITHLHGDHCLGLPGVVQRLALDAVGREVHLCYPAEGEAFMDQRKGSDA